MFFVLLSTGKCFRFWENCQFLKLDRRGDLTMIWILPQWKIPFLLLKKPKPLTSSIIKSHYSAYSRLCLTVLVGRKGNFIFPPRLDFPEDANLRPCDPNLYWLSRSKKNVQYKHVKHPRVTAPTFVLRGFTGVFFWPDLRLDGLSVPSQWKQPQTS